MLLVTLQGFTDIPCDGGLMFLVIVDYLLHSLLFHPYCKVTCAAKLPLHRLSTGLLTYCLPIVLTHYSFLLFLPIVSYPVRSLWHDMPLR